MASPSSVPWRPAADTPVAVHGHGAAHASALCAGRDGPGASLRLPRPLRDAVRRACGDCGAVLTALGGVLTRPAGGAFIVGAYVDMDFLLDARTVLAAHVLMEARPSSSAGPAPWAYLVDAATAAWLSAHTGLPSVDLAGVDPAAFTSVVETARALWTPEDATRYRSFADAVAAAIAVSAADG